MTEFKDFLKNNWIKIILSIASIIIIVILIIYISHSINLIKLYEEEIRLYTEDTWLITELKKSVSEYTHHIITYIFSIMLIIAFNLYIWFSKIIFAIPTPEARAAAHQARQEKKKAQLQNKLNKM